MTYSMCCQAPMTVFRFPATAPTPGSANGWTRWRTASGSKTVSPSTMTTMSQLAPRTPLLSAAGFPAFSCRMTRTPSMPSRVDAFLLVVRGDDHTDPPGHLGPPTEPALMAFAVMPPREDEHHPEPAQHRDAYDHEADGERAHRPFGERHGGDERPSARIRSMYSGSAAMVWDRSPPASWKRTDAPFPSSGVAHWKRVVVIPAAPASANWVCRISRLTRASDCQREQEQQREDDPRFLERRRLARRSAGVGRGDRVPGPGRLRLGRTAAGRTPWTCVRSCRRTRAPQRTRRRVCVAGRAWPHGFRWRARIAFPGH